MYILYNCTYILSKLVWTLLPYLYNIHLLLEPFANCWCSGGWQRRSLGSQFRFTKGRSSKRVSVVVSWVGVKKKVVKSVYLPTWHTSTVALQFIFSKAISEWKRVHVQVPRSVAGGNIYTKNPWLVGGILDHIFTTTWGADPTRHHCLSAWNPYGHQL